MGIILLVDLHVRQRVDDYIRGNNERLVDVLSGVLEAVLGRVGLQVERVGLRKGAGLDSI